MPRLSIFLKLKRRSRYDIFFFKFILLNSTHWLNCISNLFFYLYRYKMMFRSVNWKTRVFCFWLLLKDIKLLKNTIFNNNFRLQKKGYHYYQILPIRLCLNWYMTTITLVNLLIKHYSYNYLFNICLFKFIVICKPKL